MDEPGPPSEQNPVLAGLRRERKARYGGEADSAPDKRNLGKFFTDALSGFRAFGQKLGSGGFNIGFRFINHILTHKGEIAVSAAGGAAAKTAARIFLAGSGGVIPALAIGAAGGATSGALKEYWKQRGNLEIEEAGNKLLIDGLRNEWRRIGASDKSEIGLAALRGAAWGAAGGIFSEGIAENEWVQEKLSKIMPRFGDSSTSQPAAEATPTPRASLGGIAEEPPAPTKTPALTATAIPSPTATAAEATNTPTPISSPTATPTETVLPEPSMPSVPQTPLQPKPELLSPESQPAPVSSLPEALQNMPEVIELLAGSNPWDQVSEYGEKYLGRPLTNAEKLLLTKELCRQSGIAVPGWNLSEGVDHTKLKVGFRLIFNDPVKKLLEELKTA